MFMRLVLTLNHLVCLYNNQDLLSVNYIIQPFPVCLLGVVS